MITLRLQTHEAMAIRDAMAAVDAEYGFYVYPDDGQPTGSWSGRPVAEHEAAKMRGEWLLSYINRRIEEERGG